MFSWLFKKETPKIEITKYLPIYKAILDNNVNSLGNIKNIINQIPYEREYESEDKKYYHDNLYPPALIYAIWLCNIFKISKDENQILENIYAKNNSQTVESHAREQLKQIIIDLIQKGADPNLKYNKTALMYAVEYNDDDMINFLLDNGANFDATNNYGHTTLMYAILHKIDKVKLLISMGADVTKKSSEDQTTLMYAIQSSNIDIVELLLDKITDETQRIEFINQVGTYYSALMYAVMYNDFDMVKLLLEKGANPNIISKYGNTALNSAIMFSNEKYYYYNKEKYKIPTHEMTNQIVTLLLNYGADPNLKDNHKKTALIHAAEYPTKYPTKGYYYKEDPGNAYSEIVQVLLKNGAKPNLKDNAGKTALIHAAEYPTKGYYYKEDKEDPDDKEDPGTFAFVSKMNAYSKIVYVLLKYHANPNLKDDYGKTALDYAKPDSDISILLTPKRKGGSTKSRRLKTKKTVKKYRKKPQN